MPNYLHTAEGTLNSSFPWSFTAKSTSTVTEAAAETAWAAGIAAWFNLPAFNAFLSADVELTETSTSTATVTWKQSTLTRTSHTIVGTGTKALPYHTSEIVTLRSALATKYGHGRWYVPPMDVTALATTGFILSTAAQTALRDAVNAAFASWAGVLNLQILHRHGSIDGVVAANSTSQVIAGDVANTFAVQRRRADKSAVSRLTLTI